MTVEAFPRKRPEPDDAAVRTASAILREVDAALDLVRSKPELDSLVPFLEAAQKEARRILDHETPTPN